MLPGSLLLFASILATAGGFEGYYRAPAIHGDTVVFTAEGDLWKVPASGGEADRLTAHPDFESFAAISPDGRWLAFTGRYEGPSEVYIMPLAGGVPKRLTYHGDRSEVVGFTPDGRVLYRTSAYSTLPKAQLVAIRPDTGAEERIPLYQASDGVFDPKTGTLYFVRFAKQGSKTKRYRGGTAQQIWRFDPGAKEAVPLTADFAGTSEDPMLEGDRLYFVSDRDGVMNLWSMRTDGGDLRQHTHHRDFDAKSAASNGGRIVYQQGADLRLYDIASGRDQKIPIRLASDLDHMREKWVKAPIEFLTSASPSPDGDRVALTARGQIFVAPVGPGRLVDTTRRPNVRFREAQFFPDGKSLFAVSDQSGELEFWRIPADGIGKIERLTENEPAFLFGGQVSPDGRLLAYVSLDQRLWLYDLKSRLRKKIGESGTPGNFSDLAWSPDSKWLAYSITGSNLFERIEIYSVDRGKSVPITSDRVDSYGPVFEPNGEWLYFLSDRRFVSKVPSPWGPRAPEPYLDRATEVYLVPLVSGLRSPFAPKNELVKKEKDGDQDEKKKEEEKKRKRKKEVTVHIDLGGIADRIVKAPVEAGNYSKLRIGEDLLFLLTRKDAFRQDDQKQTLSSYPITDDPKKQKLATVLADVKDYELTRDRKKLMVAKGKDILVFDAKGEAPAKPNEAKVDLSRWIFSLDPRLEWRQIFVEAWRLERDYFYDTHMNGLDWKRVLTKYLPLVERVSDRGELSDLIGEMVGELSALHIFVFGGDFRAGNDKIMPASLGARLARAPGGALSVEHIYASDPVYPEKRAPLSRPGVEAEPGDLILAIDGVPTASLPDPRAALRNKAHAQVRLQIESKRTGKTKDVIVEPISPEEDFDLRYGEWEYSRRIEVEEKTKGRVGYVHLRAMGGQDYQAWARDFFPVFDREGLIIDVRNNRGGNIDSWILSRLLRKAWFYWQPRTGQPIWNMQYAFRGHLVVLVDEQTSSDGEAFAEGFRRLGLGKVIGTRTWGGEIWLSMDNWLVDRGIASAAETGVYAPEGTWLIEGHGVDPDLVVDDLPHATFEGHDAQLDAAIEHVMARIAAEPIPVPPHPRYPDKRLK